ncbi:hypothetical protein C8R44DRAFT_754197 [Mycena epipterygia]|nr:hypothetical protein C8R44DRAFT_754197 [Mycena epipterygia]
MDATYSDSFCLFYVRVGYSGATCLLRGSPESGVHRSSGTRLGSVSPVRPACAHETHRPSRTESQRFRYMNILSQRLGFLNSHPPENAAPSAHWENAALAGTVLSHFGHPTCIARWQIAISYVTLIPYRARAEDDKQTLLDCDHGIASPSHSSIFVNAASGKLSRARFWRRFCVVCRRQDANAPSSQVLKLEVLKLLDAAGIQDARSRSVGAAARRAGAGPRDSSGAGYGSEVSRKDQSGQAAEVISSPIGGRVKLPQQDPSSALLLLLLVRSLRTAAGKIFNEIDASRHGERILQRDFYLEAECLSARGKKKWDKLNETTSPTGTSLDLREGQTNKSGNPALGVSTTSADHRFVIARIRILRCRTAEALVRRSLKDFLDDLVLKSLVHVGHHLCAHEAPLTADNVYVEIVKSARAVKPEEGVEYESTASGSVAAACGNITLATGRLHSELRLRGHPCAATPDLLALATTNAGPTGDGRLASALAQPAGLCDIDQVHVHPTGFVDFANPAAKTKFLAAEALRRVSKGLKKWYPGAAAAAFAADTGIPLESIPATFASHDKYTSSAPNGATGFLTFHGSSWLTGRFRAHVRRGVKPRIEVTDGGLFLLSNEFLSEQHQNLGRFIARCIPTDSQLFSIQNDA